jgi:hypothetical protein
MHGVIQAAGCPEQIGRGSANGVGHHVQQSESTPPRAIPHAFILPAVLASLESCGDCTSGAMSKKRPCDCIGSRRGVKEKQYEVVSSSAKHNTSNKSAFDVQDLAIDEPPE